MGAERCHERLCSFLFHGRTYTRLPPSGGGRGGIRPDIRGGKEGEERQRREGEDKRLTKEKR